MVESPRRPLVAVDAPRIGPPVLAGARPPGSPVVPTGGRDAGEALLIDEARAARVRVGDLIEDSCAVLDRAAAAVHRTESRLERSRRALARWRRVQAAREQEEIDRESARTARALEAGHDPAPVAPGASSGWLVACARSAPSPPPVELVSVSALCG